MLGVAPEVVQVWFPPLGEPAAHAEQELLEQFLKKESELLEEVYDSWECMVTLDEPLTPADQERYQEAVKRLGII